MVPFRYRAHMATYMGYTEITTPSRPQRWMKKEPFQVLENSTMKFVAK